MLSRITLCGFCFFVLLISVLLSGCGEGNNTIAANQTGHFGSLEFALTTTKTTFTRGEQVPLIFTVKNTGSQTVNLVGGGCMTLFKVIQRGQDISPGFACGAGGYTFSLAPGETRTFNTTWDQKDPNGDLVPAGQDTITMWLTAGNVNGTQLTDLEAEQDLSSNPIQITVTP